MLFNSKDLVVVDPENAPSTADHSLKKEAIGLISDQGENAFIADTDKTWCG